MARDKHVDEMERAVCASTGIPEFPHGCQDMVRFLGFDPNGFDYFECERLKWERIDRPLIEARQNYIIDAVWEGRPGLWRLISYLTGRCGSHERMFAAFPVLEELASTGPHRLFWRLMTDIWPVCDRTFEWQDCLLGMMDGSRETAPARRHDHKQPIKVYRGCDRTRVNGISWTRDRAVAAKFATGMRAGKQPDPVVVTALASREVVFFYDNSRKEREVVLDPEGLKDLVVEPFDTAKPLAA